MDQKSVFEFIDQTLSAFDTIHNPISKRARSVLLHFYKTYAVAAIENGKEYKYEITKHADATLHVLKNTPEFPPFHSSSSYTKEYFQGISFLEKIVDLKTSTVTGKQNFSKIQKQLHNKENVILFANHQIEADPQAISLLIGNQYPFVKDIIYIAGDRVTTDPIAIPLSLGHNLICIYSNKYIQSDKETLASKRTHNKKALSILQAKLHAGGVCIYVAPSGGRDRIDGEGFVKPSPFDYKSVELLYSIGKRANTQTHTYPLALATYSILPPPLESHVSQCENREAKNDAIHISCGDEINLNSIFSEDKLLNKKLRAKHVYDSICNKYYEIKAPYIKSI